MSNRKTYRFAGLIASVALLAACGESEAPSESAPTWPQLTTGLPDPNVPHTCTWQPNGDHDCNIIVTGSPAMAFGSTNAQPITFTFSPAMQDLHSYIEGFYGTGYCTTQPWSTMTWTAFKPDGSFAESGVYFNSETGCSQFNSFPEIIMHLHFQGPVSTLVVNPPSTMPPDVTTDGRALLFYFYYNPACPPSGDPALDATTVRLSLLQILADAKPNTDPTLRQRRETGGRIVHDRDGRYRAVKGSDPQATVCDYSHARETVQLQPGDTVIGGIHSHEHKENEPVFDDCKRVPPGKVGRAHPSINGGGSDQDWDDASSSGVPEYVITNEGTLARLMPNTPQGSARINNPNRWTFDLSNPMSCFTKIN